VVRSLLLLCRTQDPATFPAGGGGEPAGKRGWIAYGCELTNEMEPDVLPDIVGIHLAQSVSAAYRPDQRGISLEEFVPGLLVAVPGTCHQCGDRSGTRNSFGVRLPCFAVALLVPQLPLAGVCQHLTAVLAGELAGDVGVH
jgi:hypothetical protein